MKMQKLYSRSPKSLPDGRQANSEIRNRMGTKNKGERPMLPVSEIRIPKSAIEYFPTLGAQT